jgi:8-oxo-dGTP pyrophosphatase MutT (NUDIX family)
VGWRAPGGGIELGETSEQAVRREILEEVGVELDILKFRGAVEGFIRWRGEDEHEIVFLFEGRPKEWGRLAESDRIEGIEENGKTLDLHWVDPRTILGSGDLMYPEGIWPTLLRHYSQQIRATALCAIERDGAYLAFDIYDPITKRNLVRFPGGGIEHGEFSVDAVRREMREELNTELADLRLLGVLENIFGFQGQPAHELVFLFAARAANAAIYATNENVAAETNEEVPLRWVTLEEMTSGGTVLVPEGALELLRSS